MKTARISSPCECHARLFADVDQHCHVLRGWAVDREREEERIAPAQRLRHQGDGFDVSWLCPFCIRNTLRMFAASGLAWRETAQPVSTT